MGWMTFLRRLSTEPIVLFKSIVLYYWLKYLGKYRRFNLYDVASGDPNKNNTIIPPLEYQVEKPLKILPKNTSDVIFLYCGNVAGDRLVARICRESEGHVSWLYLRLSDGRSYQLPHPEKNYPPSEEFMAGGLRIKCLLPMRKWRISFNGLLRESSEGSKDTCIVHVKFSFWCKTSSYPFDLSTDISPELFADYLAKESSTVSICTPQSVTQYLDSYVQACQLFGSICIDGGEATEMYIWGARKRSRDVQRPKGVMHMNEFLSYTKDGQLLYSAELILPGFKASLPIVFYLERTTMTWPVTSCLHKHSGKQPSFNGLTIDFQTVRSSVTASVSPPSQSIKWRALGLDTTCHVTTFKLQDGDVGHGVYLENTWNYRQSDLFSKPAWQLPAIEHISKGSVPTLLPLDDPRCQNPSLSGGKGSSLTTLTLLARKYKTNFKVPGGFVLTTEAYNEFLSKSAMKATIDKFQEDAWSYQTEKMKTTCNQLVEKLTKVVLTDRLKDMIRKQISEQFTDIGNKRRFAVRSSAAGEDSEEMSAAGQMSTILGVEGLDNICKAASACWASQFSFTAIQYKRQNGQELNSPMAVVVQEMVPADTAGVLFTCDPVTGNPQNVTITANYGLGESVVSASAEPDTIVMQRDENNQIQLKSVQVGKKKTRIVMGDQGNVLEELVEESSTSNCCISDKQAQVLTEACLKIEDAYGFPVDIEWAFKDTLLYMLQARPITTFDRLTKFDMYHCYSNAIRAEDEYTTKANVGEVMPGAVTPFGISLSIISWTVCFGELYAHRNPNFMKYNPFYQQFPMYYHHTFMSMPQFILRFYKKGVQSFLSEANIYAGFGRKLDNEDLYDQADKRNRMYPSTFMPFQMIFFITDMIFGEGRLNKAIDKLWNSEVDMSKCSNSKEMLYHMTKAMLKGTSGSGRHMDATTNSTILNNIVLGILATDNKGWDASVFSDFSLILSSCGQLESADIPRMTLVVINEIKKSTDFEKFKTMDTQEACDWLEKSTTSAGTAFREFIRRHGHRCWKEFDLFTKPWRIDKLPFVKNLQESSSHDLEDDKAFVSTEEVIKRLKVKVSRKSRFLLKFLIPLCRNAVLNREKSKSFAVKIIDNMMRKSSWILAEQLFKEGRLPEKELMFFLDIHEILELINTRSPYLVQRAIRLKQTFAELNNMKFPELFQGIPVPMNLRRKDLDAYQDSDLEMFGTPVSQGVVSGFARVAVDIEEAANIQPGEILIAYSTDVAWSPYFPILSGVVTELGGLISHGAVVAREYGLPCVVGVTDATAKFQTGDYVYLDGNKGILKRIKAPEKK